jgi:phosphatidylserine/phosphatidylglycerophosphate/cardiolipin synthase-like enzyme
MNPDEMDEILRSTLEDHRLSRSERRALREVVADARLSTRERAAFRAQAFSLARGEIEARDDRAAVMEWLEDVVRVLGPKESGMPNSKAAFSPGEHCLRMILSLIRNSMKCMDICVFTVTDDRISDALLDAHRRGRRIRLVTDDDKSEDRGSDIDRLERAGIPVRTDRTEHHMHHKFALFDARTLLTGSYNWTRSAAANNQENLIVTDDQTLVAAFVDTFERTWTRFGEP